MSNTRQTVKFGKGRLDRFAAVKTFTYSYAATPGGNYKVAWRAGVVRVEKSL